LDIQPLTQDGPENGPECSTDEIKREAADVLGVSHTTVQNDLANELPENGNKVATDELGESAIVHAFPQMFLNRPSASAA
jgi:hypothetical protein